MLTTPKNQDAISEAMTAVGRWRRVLREWRRAKTSVDWTRALLDLGSALSVLVDADSQEMLGRKISKDPDLASLPGVFDALKVRNRLAHPFDIQETAPTEEELHASAEVLCEAAEISSTRFVMSALADVSTDEVDATVREKTSGRFGLNEIFDAIQMVPLAAFVCLGMLNLGNIEQRQLSPTQANLFTWTRGRP